MNIKWIKDKQDRHIVNLNNHLSLVIMEEHSTIYTGNPSQVISKWSASIIRNPEYPHQGYFKIIREIDGIDSIEHAKELIVNAAIEYAAESFVESIMMLRALQ